MIIKKIITVIIIIFFYSLNMAMASKKILNINDINIDTLKLKSTVRYLTEIYPFRSFGNTASLDKSAEYLMEKFKKYGNNARYQVFNVEGIEYKNVLCSLGPEMGPRIVIGAHYDVFGSQMGADDNASAVAGLVEILRILSNNPEELNYKVDFAAYCLEEPPNFGTKNMGSYHHAKMLHDSRIEIRGMICLEMIGYFTEEEDSQKFPLSLMGLFYPTTGNFIAVVANFSSSSLSKELQNYMRQSDIDVQRLTAPSFIQGVDFSDHKNFWKFGFDAVMITDTAFYRNSNYHEVTDTIDTLNFNKMSEVIKGIIWAVINLK